MERHKERFNSRVAEEKEIAKRNKDQNKRSFDSEWW